MFYPCGSRFLPPLPATVYGDNLTVARYLEYLNLKVQDLEERVKKLEEGEQNGQS